MRIGLLPMNISRKNGLLAEKTVQSRPREKFSTFSLHLTELRHRVLYFLFSLFSTFLAGTYYSNVLTHLICTPFSTGKEKECILFIWTHVTEGLYAALNVSLVYTVFFCVPALVYQFYSFLMPSFYQEERKSVNIILFFATLLLLVSIGGCAFFFLPKIYYFLEGFQYSSKCMEIKLQARIGPAVEFLSNAFLLTAFFFQVPVLLAVCIYWQVIDCDFLKKRRRYFFFSLVLISSLLSPPDLSSQSTLAGIIILFYELFLWSALFHQRWINPESPCLFMAAEERGEGARESKSVPILGVPE